MPDGRVLIYDFGGCSTEAVMEAIGLTLGDLWNKPLDHCLSPVRRGFSAREVIEMTSHEAMVAAELAVTARERALTDEESARLEQAASRLLTAQTLTQ